MPRAKRNKEVTLSKVKPKGRDHKENQLQRLQAAAQANPFCYLFSVGNMRNNHLKEVREKWKGSSIFWGMNGVARKALGVNPENEIVEGISEITKRLQGPVGLLFTSSPPSITLPWFQSYSASSYLRGGQISPKTVVLNKGPVQTASTEIGGQSPDLETLSHSIEPQLRKLGMPTELKMGVPTLLRDFDVAKVGKVVSTENAQILKHILLPLSTFKIIPLCIFTNPNLSSAAENQDPDSTFSSTDPAIKESTSLNESTILLKLNQEDQRAVDESMKGITIGKKDGNNGNGRASKRKTRKEAIESNLKGDDMDQDDDEEDEEMDEDAMDDDAVGASMMLPDSMKVV